MTIARYPTAKEMLLTVPSAEVYIGDQMDRAMDRLRTAHLALSPENRSWLDDDNLMAVWATIEQCIRDFEPVRNVLQGCNAQTGRVGE